MDALNSILLRPGSVRNLGPNLCSALPETASVAPYDRRVAVYEAVVGRSIYHRFFWGTSAPGYRLFARLALEAADHGYFAEVGCGSLMFTAEMYRNYRGTLALLVDRSMAMLRRAEKRLSPGGPNPPEGVLLLHSDCADMPLCSKAFASILCLNVLHVPCDALRITSECGRLLIPGVGRLFVSSLVRSGRWSDSYLALLHRMGELAAPMSPDELHTKVAAPWGVVESTKVEGNMSYLVVRHAG